MLEWLRTSGENIWNSTVQYLPMIGSALAILVGGWLLAYILRAVTFAGLKRMRLDSGTAHRLGIRGGEQHGYRAERLASKTVYYVVLVFVIVAFLGQLRIKGVTEPIVGALSGITSAIPSLINALLIGFIGFLVAKLVRRGIVALVDRTGLSARLARMSAEGAERRAAERAQELTVDGTSKLASTLGDVAYWLILALVAIPVLDALKVGVLSKPLSNAVAVITTYLPRVLGAALLLGLGYIAGRLLRSLTTTVAHRIGVDSLVARLGGGRVLKGQSLSGILGSFVMAFVLLHFAVSAVGQLGIAEISEPLSGFLAAIYDYLPRLFVGVLVLAVGIAFARIAGNVASTLLAAMGFNTLMAHVGLSHGSSDASRAQEDQAKGAVAARREGKIGENEEGEDRLLTQGATAASARTPADVGGLVVYVVLGIIVLGQALETMELHGFAALLGRFIAYMPSLFAAVAVLAAAMWAGRWARDRVNELTGATTGEGDRALRSLGTISHVAIVGFGGMVALQQLGVASSLIGTAFGLLLGALCLAGALAFGLGGREVAADIVKRQYEQRRNTHTDVHRAVPGPAE